MTEIERLTCNLETQCDALIESFRTNELFEEHPIQELLSTLRAIQLHTENQTSISKRLAQTLLETIFILSGQTKPTHFKKNELLNAIFDAFIKCLE